MNSHGPNIMGNAKGTIDIDIYQLFTVAGSVIHCHTSTLNGFAAQ